MAWANNAVFTQLSELPEEALAFSAWNPEWTVGKIANHIVIAQGRFISRLQKLDAPNENEFPLTKDGMKSLVAKSATNDAEIIKLIDQPEEMLTFMRYGKSAQFLNTTVIAQIIHHATEHRAQIADIMAVNKMDVIDLDSLDLWAFERLSK